MFDNIVNTFGNLFSSETPATALAAHEPAAAAGAPSGGGLAPEVARTGLSSSIDHMLDGFYAAQGWDRAAMQQRAEQREGMADTKLGAAKMIGAEWMKPGDVDGALLDPRRSLGDLDSKEERLAALSKLVQNDPSDPNSEFECGPTSLIAAAIYSQGAQGMETLMKSIEGDGGDKDRAKQFAALRARMKKGGELNVGDVQMMKHELYEALQDRQKALAGDNHINGIVGVTMKDFIQKQPELAAMFADGQMSLDLTDTDGDATMNHYVLGIRDPAGWRTREGAANTVFDPYARKGGQLVTVPDQVLDYANAWHENVGQ